MTLDSTISRVTYAGDGLATIFQFPYYFLIEADLVVYLTNTTTKVQTLQVLDTDYTVAGEGNILGGSITFVVVPPVGVTVTIFRAPSEIQDLDLTENGEFPPEELETRLDKLTMEVQRLSNLAARSVKLLDGFVDTFDTNFPEELPADFLVGINATGDAIALLDPADVVQNATVNVLTVAHQELLAGVSNGVNTTFGPTTYVPLAAASVEVFVDGVYRQFTTAWTLNGSNAVVFNAGFIPAAGQPVEVYYLRAPTVTSTAITPDVEYRLVTAGEAVAKSLTLANTPMTPTKTVLDWGPSSGALLGQYYGGDFTVAGAVVSWAGLGLDGVIVAGDRLRISYYF